MKEIRQTAIFSNWLSKVKDSRAKQKIAIRIRRLAFGNPGDVKPVGNGISELRITEGKGYRVYYVQHKNCLIMLLCGGDKQTQDKDIRRAKELLSELKEEGGFY